MIRYVLLLCLAAFAVLGVVVGKERLHGNAASILAKPQQVPASAGQTNLGAPLYATAALPVRSASSAAGNSASANRLPIVLPECRLVVCEKQDVPSQREGVLLFVGTEVEPGEKAAPDQLVTITIGTEAKTLRRLREGDAVRAGQLLAYLDDRLARDEWAIKQARLIASKADLEAALKSGEEAKNKFDIQQRLWQNGRAASEEEVRTAKLNWEKAVYEAIGKQEAVKLADRELNQAETVLRMHQIRAGTPGIIKTIYKRRGEALKALEPVVQIHNLDRLRVEGQLDVEHLARLTLGMAAFVEPSRREGPQHRLVGHFQEVTGVAVARDNARLVSGSDDSSVRVWDRSRQQEIRAVMHPAAVRTVACSPAASSFNYCLTGAADGKARVFDLDKPGEPVRELFGRHDGAITCVAFSPDGRVCATGGADCDIRVWDVALGALRYRLASAHAGAVTSVQFTPQARLVSAGRDNTLRIWSLGERGASLLASFERRSGAVSQLGVSADGQRLLYDEPGVLRVLSVPEGRTDGIVRHPAAANFTKFAGFSPDATLILTATDGGLHLWRTPTAGTRARELRQWRLPENAVATCAAFAADGSFVVAGTRERQVLLWQVPAATEAEQRFTATVSLLEHAEEAGTRQVRIWAELPNPKGLLLPGMSATMVLP